MTHNQAVGGRSGTRFCNTVSSSANTSSLQTLYRHLINERPDEAVDAEADAFLRERLSLARNQRIDLPHEIDELEHWVARQAVHTGTEFQQYLSERRAGSPRRFFRHRAHALGFLRASAPTKLVDGAWLYGLAKHWRDIRLRDLIATWLDELGEGFASHNHVAVYTRLLAEHECDDWAEELSAQYFLQGITQAALGRLSDDYFPEVLGYNLGYEQPPLHMLITAHELAELDINPWYFTLHATVDNAASGHAIRAARGVRRAMPVLGDRHMFWKRVRTGFALSQMGPGAIELIDEFDLDAEVVRVLRKKARIGQCMHNNRMHIEGRTINEWLRHPQDIPRFLVALQRNGWIVRGREPEHSRFWRALVGRNAPMCGVFTRYECQLLSDWIRDEKDLSRVGDVPGLNSFRRSGRKCAGGSPSPHPRMIVSDEEARLLAMLERMEDEEAAMKLLLPLLGPHSHAVPAGLLATRMYRRMFEGQSLSHAMSRERVT